MDQSELAQNAFKIIQAKLQESKDKQGYNIYDHLNEIFSKLITKPDDWSYEKFEKLSQFIKMTRLNLDAPKTDKEVNNPEISMNRILLYLNNAIELINQNYKNKISAPIGNIQDLIQDVSMFNWAGISFGECESFMIANALKKLAIKSKTKIARFWGKIFGKSNDYYIIETKANPGDNFETIQGQEPKGKGLNENIYWVSTNILENWVQLPDAKPQFISVARKFKKVFSGDLESTVYSYPFFEGKEKDLLRAQIARITHSTYIVPTGIYQVSENDEREVSLKEEIAIPTMEELVTPENWVHRYSNILFAGRTEHLKPEKISEDQDPDEMLERLKESDPYIDRLKGINEDEPFPKFETGWVIKPIGDPQQYAQLPPKEGNLAYNVIVIKPYRWPGSVTVFSKGRFQSIYIGNAIKAGGLAFNPLGPDMLKTDPISTEEMPEPTPLKPPPEPVEPDTEKKEDEKKEEGEEEEES